MTIALLSSEFAARRQSGRAQMDRYYFDVFDGEESIDKDGMALADRKAVETAAMKTLFDSGRLEAANNQRGTVTVTVRNKAGAPVYRATLNMQAGWLIPAAK